VDLNHSFTVPASLADTWKTFEDIESVAGCFPGAVVTSVEGNDFKGTCKVKLGPIAMLYSGSGTFLEKDEAAGKFVIDAKGKDKRGNGTAGAVVTAQFVEESPGTTRVDVATDLAITGKPAQFGRGVIEDISNKLLQQFVTCLQDKVGAAPDTGPAAGSDAGAAEVGGGQSADAGEVSGVTAVPTGSAPQMGADSPAFESVSESASASVGSSVGSEPGPRPASAAPRATSASDDDALDLGATVLPILARTYGPQAALALVFLVLGYLLGRRRG
jgi:carbon monoxide dehydrogenase subunit G